VGFIGFGSGFTQNPLFFMGLSFLKPYLPNHPTQPTFLDFSGGFDRFFGLIQSMNTPIKNQLYDSFLLKKNYTVV